jgi:hypothetical protein
MVESAVVAKQISTMLELDSDKFTKYIGTVQ